MPNFPPQGNLSPTIVIGEIDDATLVIESEGIASNDNDLTFPTSAAVKDYSDTTSISNTLTDSQIFVGNGSNVATDVAVTGDISISNAGVVAIAAAVIVNADVNASAAIDYSKLAALTDGNILVGNVSNVATSVNPSGDIDISNAGVFSISSGVIVDADLASGAFPNITGVGTIASGTWEGTTIAVNQGGTGVTSSTGTGAVVLSTSPTLITPILGTPSSGTLNMSSITLSGTKGQFNTALSDDDFLFLGTTQSITGLKTFLADLKFTAADIRLQGNKLSLSVITLQEVSNVAELTILDNTAGAGIKIQNTDGSFSLTNGTGTVNQFLPTFLGVSKGSTKPGLFFVGEIPVADDTGTTTVVKFDARRVGPASVVTRPLFQFTNSGAVQWEMAANGNVDMQGNDLSLGNITTGVWNGTVISSAFLDADTMHLSVAQSISGAKTFEDNGILIESPDNLTPVTLVNAQQTLARNLTIPILTGNRNILVSGQAQIVDADIAFSTITLARIQLIPTNRLLGRETGGTGVIEEILLNSTLEMIPFAQVLQRAALTGDVTSPAGSNVLTYNPSSIVNADIASGTFPNITGLGVQTQALPMGGNDVSNVGFFSYSATLELTIATGVITVSRTNHDVDTESDASSDALTDIQDASNDGRMLIIRATDPARTVVVTDGGGSIRSAGDFSLDENTDKMVFFSNQAVWTELSRSNNAA